MAQPQPLPYSNTTSFAPLTVSTKHNGAQNSPGKDNKNRALERAKKYTKIVEKKFNEDKENISKNSVSFLSSLKPRKLELGESKKTEEINFQKSTVAKSETALASSSPTKFEASSKVEKIEVIVQPTQMELKMVDTVVAKNEEVIVHSSVTDEASKPALALPKEPIRIGAPIQAKKIELVENSTITKVESKKTIILSEVSNCLDKQQEAQKNEDTLDSTLPELAKHSVTVKTEKLLDLQPEIIPQPDPQPDVQPQPHPDVQPQPQPDIKPQPDPQPDVLPQPEIHPTLSNNALSIPEDLDLVERGTIQAILNSEVVTMASDCSTSMIWKPFKVVANSVNHAWVSVATAINNLCIWFFSPPKYIVKESARPVSCYTWEAIVENPNEYYQMTG
ncbi:MAG: hypothetical protein H0V82_07895 [Candidatus Protochlamydia sp.]|nr:hypothetical protein [Candidatus Protochlamydia sp.]